MPSLGGPLGSSGGRYELGPSNPGRLGSSLAQRQAAPGPGPGFGPGSGQGRGMTTSPERSGIRPAARNVYSALQVRLILAGAHFQ